MSTVIRADISATNPYYISKHRFYELKHFCLQYPEWKKIAANEIYPGHSELGMPRNKTASDPVFDAVARRELCLKKMAMVEQAAIEASGDIYQYLIKSVTKNVSYISLQTSLGIPCSRDYFYERYRKFFWILDRIRE